MLEKKRPSQLLTDTPPRRIRRTMGGVVRSMAVSRLLMLLALVSALFGGVGLEVCLSEPGWEKHAWLPFLLIALAVSLLLVTLLHAISRNVFGK